jgi:hypothetical protein
MADRLWRQIQANPDGDFDEEPNEDFDKALHEEDNGGGNTNEQPDLAATTSQDNGIFSGTVKSNVDETRQELRFGPPAPFDPAAPMISYGQRRNWCETCDMDHAPDAECPEMSNMRAGSLTTTSASINQNATSFSIAEFNTNRQNASQGLFMVANPTQASHGLQTENARYLNRHCRICGESGHGAFNCPKNGANAAGSGQRPFMVNQGYHAGARNLRPGLSNLIQNADSYLNTGFNPNQVLGQFPVANTVLGIYGSQTGNIGYPTFDPRNRLCMGCGGMGHDLDGCSRNPAHPRNIPFVTYYGYNAGVQNQDRRRRCLSCGQSGGHMSHCLRQRVQQVGEPPSTTERLGNTNDWSNVRNSPYRGRPEGGMLLGAELAPPTPAVVNVGDQESRREYPEAQLVDNTFLSLPGDRTQLQNLRPWDIPQNCAQTMEDEDILARFESDDEDVVNSAGPGYLGTMTDRGQRLRVFTHRPEHIVRNPQLRRNLVRRPHTFMGVELWTLVVPQSQLELLHAGIPVTPQPGHANLPGKPHQK